jgi:hypothetical protein
MGSGGEIINLNVGGQRFSTSRHTLTAIPVSSPPFILQNKNSSYATLFVSVADPDPYVFEPPGSINKRYGSRSGSGSFYHQAKIVRKTLIPSVL